MQKLAVGILVVLSVQTSYGATQYWDTDGSNAGNSTLTGANLGGTGNWSTAISHWWDGAATRAGWTEGNDAVFWGTAATVTLSGPRTANGISFRTTGYTIAASSLTLTGAAAISVEPGETATIASTLAGTVGYNISGGGRVILNQPSNLNSIRGPVSVTQGSILELPLSGQIGSTTAGAGNVTLNNGTLRNTDSAGSSHVFLTSNRQIVIGNLGGTIDATTEPGTYNGTISGTGTLTKVGAGEFRYQGTGLPNTTYTKLVVNEGLFRLGFANSTEDERGFGAVPGSVLTDAIRLNGGSIAHSFNPITLHQNRGITIGPNGGTFAGGSMTIPGPLSGSGKLTIGAGTINLSNPTNTVTFTGSIETSAGSILTLSQSLNAANLTGSGGTINISAGRTFTVGSGGMSTSYGGVIGSAGALNKVGAGTLTLTSANTYAGGTVINGGKVYANNGTGSATGSGSVTILSGTLGGTGSVAGNVIVNSGGVVAPGTSIESLNVGGLTFNAGATLEIELDSSASLTAAADLLNGSGGLSIATGAMLDLSDIAGTSVALAAGTRFTLVRYDATAGWNGGTFDGLADDSFVTVGANTYQINYNDTLAGVNFGGGAAGGLYLTLSVPVPEASAFLFGGLAMAGGLAAAWKRRRRA